MNNPEDMWKDLDEEVFVRLSQTQAETPEKRWANLPDELFESPAKPEAYEVPRSPSVQPSPTPNLDSPGPSVPHADLVPPPDSNNTVIDLGLPSGFNWDLGSTDAMSVLAEFLETHLHNLIWVHSKLQEHQAKTIQNQAMMQCIVHALSRALYNKTWYQKLRPAAEPDSTDSQTEAGEEPTPNPTNPTPNPTPNIIMEIID
ncbi:hypothetical protein FA15DRAFT_661094 [Coprinopsis marcescibilis]|uniref:Uncharacterized protein n=1 Tax=Coprinopsis marcescibilis TaxID=230819 RepID=A0A5C3KDJ6_COPMA|nr:hypothetical protein FA15DRAFT_661094 [Coprinopsis marcescibilis]